MSKKNEKKQVQTKRSVKETLKDFDLIEFISKIDEIINEGKNFEMEGNETLACDIWLNAWDLLKSKIDKNVKSLETLDNMYSNQESIHDWCMNFEMILGNAGMKNPTFYNKRIKYCNEFIQLLPDSHKSIIEIMNIAVAESLFYIEKYDESEKEFESLSKKFPKSPWIYIRWGDLYYLSINNNKYPKNIEKAKNLYNKALTMKIDKETKEIIMDRLAEINQ